MLRTKWPSRRGSRERSPVLARALPALLTLLTVVTGCSSAGFSGEDVRLHTVGDTVYVRARSTDASRTLCASLGGDAPRAERRSASIAAGTIEPGRVSGCYTVRRIIVCPEEDGACLAHEERHRAEGAFHR